MVTTTRRVPRVPGDLISVQRCQSVAAVARPRGSTLLHVLRLVLRHTHGIPRQRLPGEELRLLIPQRVPTRGGVQTGLWRHTSVAGTELPPPSELCGRGGGSGAVGARSMTWQRGSTTTCVVHGITVSAVALVQRPAPSQRRHSNDEGSDNCQRRLPHTGTNPHRHSDRNVTDFTALVGQVVPLDNTGCDL